MTSLDSPCGCATTVPSARSWLLQHRNLLTALLLMLVAWGLYLPSVWYGFVHFDDVRILRDHPELYGQAELSQDLRAIFVTSLPREEPLPLRDITWAIDSRLFGFGNPVGYHLVNVLLHGVVVALLFAFVLKTSRRYSLALSTAAAWVILAVHTEPVAWIMGRKDILSGLFMLLALITQTRRLIAENKAAWWFWYVATIGLVCCGLLSKISVITFPLVLLLHGVFMPCLSSECPAHSAGPKRRTLWRETLLSVPNFLASASIYVWYSRTLTQMGIFDRGYTARGLAHFWNLLMIDPLVFGVYLKQLLLPSRLTLLYTWPAIQSTYSLWQVTGALTTVSLVIATGVWLLRKRKDLFFYYAAFFILMVPYLNLTYIGIWVADRYLYFAALFPILIAVSLALDAFRRPQTTARIAIVGIAAVFAGTNFFQKLSYQREWQNAETLWQYHLNLPHPSSESFANLAAYYYSVAASHQNTPESDLAITKMSVVIDAGLDQFWKDRHQAAPVLVWKLLFLRSILEEVTGRPQEALSSLLSADQLRPGFDSINLNLARLYLRLAKTSTEASRREEYTRNARDRFAAYIQLAFRGRTLPIEVRREMATMEESCRLLTSNSSG
jgi:hypothetical protein